MFTQDEHDIILSVSSPHEFSGNGGKDMLEEIGKERIEDRVNIVRDELSLGIKWDRSCLILLVYRSEFIRNIVQAILSKALVELGQGEIKYSVDKWHYDIPIELRDHPKKQQAVFFVSGLRWGGGRGYSNAYRALNMHREFLIEGNVKAIFWLTVNEGKQLARFSPDFWSFRHKVVEFLDLPSKENHTPVELSVDAFHSLYKNQTKDFWKKIETAEMLFALGCIDEAIIYFYQALRKYPDETAIYLQIAEVYLIIGRPMAGKRFLSKADKAAQGSHNYYTELNRLKEIVNTKQFTNSGFLELFSRE
jgi:tetratricopeptide (TPR) repeat protein